MKITKHFYNFFCGVILSLFIANSAWAVNVNIDPVGYEGNWAIKFVTGQLSGPQIIDLPANSSYTLTIGTFGMFFNIDAAGNVSSAATDSIVASGNTITFRNVTINFDAGNYIGSSGPRNAGPRINGSHSRVLVPGISYQLFIGTHIVPLSIDAAGQVSSTATDSITASGNVVTFNNVSITVDPNGSITPYSVRFATDRVTGIQTLVLVPGISYQFLTFGAVRGGGPFSIVAPCEIIPTTLAINDDTFDFACFNPEIQVVVDIKPGGCENPINYKSKGNTPVAILGAEDFDVSTIDVDSIRLAGQEGFKFSIEDVANSTECDGVDGIEDLTFKIQTQTLLEGIKDAVGGLSDGDTVSVEVTGNLNEDSNGTAITGGDEVSILIKGKK